MDELELNWNDSIWLQIELKSSQKSICVLKNGIGIELK